MSGQRRVRDRAPADAGPADREARRVCHHADDLGIDEGEISAQPLARALQVGQPLTWIDHGAAGALGDHLPLARLPPVVEPQVDRIVRGKERQERCRRLMRIHDLPDRHLDPVGQRLAEGNFERPRIRDQVLDELAVDRAVRRAEVDGLTRLISEEEIADHARTVPVASRQSVPSDQ